MAALAERCYEEYAEVDPVLAELRSGSDAQERRPAFSLSGAAPRRGGVSTGTCVLAVGMLGLVGMVALDGGRMLSFAPGAALSSRVRWSARMGEASQLNSLACHTSVEGEECYHHVRWAIEVGIKEHPNWYQTPLGPSSSFEEFQAVLHRGGFGGCPEPCLPGTGSCAALGCGGASPVDGCQCQAACILHGNCCADYESVCATHADEDPIGMDDGKCHTASFGTECYKRIMWVNRYGIFEHPDWYPGVNVLSTFEDAQLELYKKREANCLKPCSEVEDPSFPAPTLPPPPSGSSSKASVCNPLSPLPPDGTPSTWLLPSYEQDKCFNWLQSRGMVAQDDRHTERNWCWMGLKEFGCHRHFYDHLTWSEMQAQAIMAGATSFLPFRPLQGPELCDRQVNGGTRSWTSGNRNASHAWFKENVNAFVLSLPTSTQRRSVINLCMTLLDVPFTFVDGVDMRLPGALEGAKTEGLIPESFNASSAQEEAMTPKQGMAGGGSIMGTVGCAAGHFRAQRRGVNASNKKPITLIFEDDVCPDKDFVMKLWQLATRELPCDWQATSLYSRCPFGRCVSEHLTRVQPDINEPSWRCHHGVNYGFQAMIYRTDAIQALQTVWQPVVFDSKRPHCLDVDVALASISDQVQFYAVPAVQAPGFVRELPEGSARWDINVQVPVQKPAVA